MDSRVNDEDLDAVRGRLIAEVDSAMQGAEQVARNAESGIGDLFGGPFAEDAAVPIVVPATAVARSFTRRERLDAEKEALGLYLTGHPLDDYLDEIREFCPNRVVDLRVERGVQVRGGAGGFVAHDAQQTRRDTCVHRARRS